MIVALDERVVDRPASLGREREEVVGVAAGEHALGVVLADGVRLAAEGQRGGDLHLVEQAVAQGLLVERHVVAAPHAADQDVRRVGNQLGDVRGEVGGAELRPRLGDGCRAGNQLLVGQHEMLMHVAAVAVVRLDRRDPLCLGPGLRRADRRRDAVRRLDVGHAEDVFRLGHRLVEQEIGAAVVEHRQHAEFLGDRAEGRRVAAGNDAGEQVDLLGELHAAKLFDVGVGAGRFVGQ